MVSCLIGKMTSVAQAIPPAPLFYRSLQRDLSLALAQGNQQYNVPCPFLRKQGVVNKPPPAMEWLTPQQNMKIESDVSLQPPTMSRLIFNYMYMGCEHVLIHLKNYLKDFILKTVMILDHLDKLTCGCWDVDQF